MTSGTPWSGSLISYGGATDNGYDTQISSNYGKNRISFRTRNGDHGYWNPWNEIATSLGDNHCIKLSVGNNPWSNTAIIEIGYTAQTGDFTDLKVAIYGYSNGLIRILQNRNEQVEKHIIEKKRNQFWRDEC
ncbi:hypothetical protein [Flavobacterium ginsengiterrae]|uniref:Uncharacterized protein n=1 Tax=Flavobacterium ginsengiterrae TaxID=871695 RepID=A0ABP7GXF6_9FLAO